MSTSSPPRIVSRAPGAVAPIAPADIAAFLEVPGAPGNAAAVSPWVRTKFKDLRPAVLDRLNPAQEAALAAAAWFESAFSGDIKSMRRVLATRNDSTNLLDRGLGPTVEAVMRAVMQRKRGAELAHILRDAHENGPEHIPTALDNKAYHDIWDQMSNALEHGGNLREAAAGFERLHMRAIGLKIAALFLHEIRLWLAGTATDAGNDPAVLRDRVATAESTLTRLAADNRRLNDALTHAQGALADETKRAETILANGRADALRLVQIEAERNNLRKQLTDVAATDFTLPPLIQGEVHIPTLKAGLVKLSTLIPEALAKDTLVRQFTTEDGQLLNSTTCSLVPEIDSDRLVETVDLEALLLGLQEKHNVLIWGPTGAGKSTLVEYACALTGRPLIRINMDAGVDRLHFVGKDVIKSDGTRTWTEFQDGVLLQAMRMPCVLLVDEIDFARADVLYVLQRVLEGKGLLLMEEGNRYVPAHPEFRIVATANTNGQGDQTALYRGAKELSIATLDRFSTFVQANYLKVDDEARLLRARVPDLKKDDAQHIANFAGMVRTAFLQGDLMMTLSPRQSVAIARLTVLYGDVKPALRQVVLSRLNDDMRALVDGLIQRAFGP